MPIPSHPAPTLCHANPYPTLLNPTPPCPTPPHPHPARPYPNLTPPRFTPPRPTSPHPVPPLPPHPTLPPHPALPCPAPPTPPHPASPHPILSHWFVLHTPRMRRTSAGRRCPWRGFHGGDTTLHALQVAPVAHARTAARHVTGPRSQQLVPMEIVLGVNHSCSQWNW